MYAGITSLMYGGMTSQMQHVPQSPLAQAIAVLSRYGGSLWVSDPAYTFTNSDGTGAAGDGSDTGYVRDLCGNARPLTQATTGFKPKLKRVPKKLGPELVGNGDFSSGAGWAASSGWAIVSGAANATTGNAWSSLSQVIMSLQAGRNYQLSADVTHTSGTLYAQLATSSGAVTAFFAAASGRFSGAVVMPEGDAPMVALINDGDGQFSGSVDNVSVREVLEWTWAWVFDGVDDGLATPMQPASSAETLIVCADVSADIPNLGERIQKIDNLGGLRIYGDSSPFYAFHRTATGEEFTPLGTAANLRGVATFSCDPALQKTRMNGSNFAQKNTAYVSTSQPVTLGAGSFGASGISVFAAAYIPGVPSDAELLIVERAMAQPAGVTI